MHKLIGLLSLLAVVAYGEHSTHKVDSLLQLEGLFPGHSVNHVKGQGKQTTQGFAAKLEKSDVINAAYNKYKSHFKKVSISSNDNARKQEFKKSVLRVMEHNLHRRDGKETYGKAINRFSDMNFSEFVKKHTGVHYPKKNSTARRSVPSFPRSHSKRQASYPDSFDWRDQNMITPVKDQGQCGSCVLFATTGLVESVYAIGNGGQFVSLSEQELIDCPSNAGGCNGNMYSNILPYVQQAGLADENAYPYQTQSSGSCQSFTPIVTIQSNTNIQSGADSIASTISSTSPVAVDFRVNQDFKDYDGKSIFNSQDPDCPNAEEGHAILAIGYGTDSDSGIPYWIMKNSWGTGWGDSGFFKFARGSDLCQIEDDPWIVGGAAPASGQ